MVEPGPPSRPRNSRRSPLADLLIEVATDHPDKDVRIRDYPTKEAARITAFKLREGIRAPHSRPEGRWEFKHGPIADSTRFGVWAHFYPPGSDPAPDTE